MTPHDEALRFMEIEHKFLVSDAFDLRNFYEQLRTHSPEKEYKTDVLDTYFLVKRVPNTVYRHRYDGLIQHFTLKKQRDNDNEARVEINIDLDLKAGNQVEKVQAFLEPLDIYWSGTLRKNVQVFYFPQVEVVYYEAFYQASSLRCVEIEVREPKSLAQAQALLKSWEERLGFDPLKRSHKNLLQLLVFPQLDSELRALLES